MAWFNLFISVSFSGLCKMAETVQEVRSAEKDAEAIIEEAEEQKKEKIADAEDRAEEIVEEARQSAEEKREKELAEHRSEIEERKEQIIEQGRTEAAELEEQASKNMEDALDLLMERFREKFLR